MLPNPKFDSSFITAIELTAAILAIFTYQPVFGIVIAVATVYSLMGGTEND
ncbi:MAG: hypothetical protein ACOC3E_02585 [Cyanobacteriota bacterium]